MKDSLPPPPPSGEYKLEPCKAGKGALAPSPPALTQNHGLIYRDTGADPRVSAAQVGEEH